MQSATEATAKAEADGPNEISVLVATPVYGDFVARGFSYSQSRAMTYFALTPCDSKKYVDLQMVWSSNLVENRHKLVAYALERDFTHLLFWDPDIKAPADCIVRLVNHGLPIVAVNYPTKEENCRPTAFIDTDSYIGPCYTQAKHKGLQAVSSCGFGLMLIETRVFAAMQTPLFQFTQDGPNKVATETEDVYFCRKAREAGFDVVIDHDLSKQVAHLGGWEYTCEHANIAQAAKQHIYRGMPTSNPDVPL